VVGQVVTVQFTVTSAGGTPTGNVTVSDGTVSCNATVAVGQCDLTFTTAGAKTLTAAYAGDANYLGSASADEPHQVDRINTAVTLASSLNPSIVNQTVTFTATVSPSAATGAVTFKDNGAGIAGCVGVGVGSGQATCATATLAIGTHVITAEYSGDTMYAPSAGTLAPDQQVNGIPEVGLSPASHNFGYREVGTTSGAFTFTLTNIGTADLHLGALNIAGDFNLASDNCSGGTVAPGNSCAFDVTFAPVTAGAKTGGVSIPSDAASSPDTVNLAGNGYVTTTARFLSVKTHDGHAAESNETSNVGGYSSASGGYVTVGDWQGDRQVKGFLSFDTSSLPDGAVITGVRIELRLVGATGTNPFLTHGGLNVDIANPSFGALALAPADFEAISTADDVAACDTALAVGWFGCDLLSHLGDINLLGFTQFRLYFDLDDNDDGRPDYLRITSGNNPKAEYRPVLIVDYYIP
jgi:hypothetical protein